MRWGAGLSLEIVERTKLLRHLHCAANEVVLEHEEVCSTIPTRVSAEGKKVCVREKTQNAFTKA